MADDPHSDDLIWYTIISVVFWAIGGLLLAGLLLNRGQANWATATLAIGLAIAVYAWFGRGRIADGVRLPGRVIIAMLQS